MAEHCLKNSIHLHHDDPQTSHTRAIQHQSLPTAGHDKLNHFAPDADNENQDRPLNG
jgi:hypothetical protein